MNRKANHLENLKIMMTIDAGEKRIELLSRPKPIHDGFIDDRVSVYEDNNCSKDWSKRDLGTKFALTPRLEQLNQPSTSHKEWVPDRPSPIWGVSKGALKAKPTQRLESLSSAKNSHPDFKSPKSVYGTVSRAAKTATPSTRIETLAKSKEYGDLPIKSDSCWDYSEWRSDVTPAALKHDASTRTQSLASPKDFHKDYQEQRTVIWQISNTTKKALPSMRVQQLARPKSHSQYKEDYDNGWHRVSPGAKNARPTPRLEELSKPLPRKVRQKKQGGVKV